MLQVTINEKGGQTRQENFDKGEITIGRVQGNDIILPKGNISKRHSRIVLKDGKFIIVDLKSTNGTYVNGKKITAPQVVKASDKIYIGDFTLQLNGASAESAVEARAPNVRSNRSDEIDLFGGDSALEPEAARAPTPGLIDDNFDQEFDAPEAAAKLSRPAARRSMPARALEPEAEAEAEAEYAKLGLERAEERRLEGALDENPGADFREPSNLASRSRRSDVSRGPSRSRQAAAARIKSEARDEVSSFGPDFSLAAARPVSSSPVGLTEVPAPADEGVPKEAAAPAEVESPPVASNGPAAPRPVSEMPAAEAAPPADPAVPVAPAVIAPIVKPSISAPLDRPKVVQRLHRSAVQDLGLGSVAPSNLPDYATRTEEWAQQEVERLHAAGRVHDPAGVAEEVAKLATDLGPLHELLVDDDVVELEITPDGRILADRDGRLEPVGDPIGDPAVVSRIVRQLGVLGGADPRPEAPLVDVRLADGARVVAAMSPLSFRGPTLSLRKTSRDFFTLEKLLEYNTVSPAMMTFIDYCVRYRRNILLSIGHGVTATATLNALVAQMPTDDRVVTIEAGVELHLDGSRNLTALEPSAITPVEALLRHAVRMQADRAIVGGMTRASVFDVVRTVSGPLEGSVVAYPSPSPLEAVRRLADEDLAGHFESPARARAAVAAAFPVVLQEKKFLDNSRRIVAISEILVEEDELQAHDLFTFTAEGVDENLIVTGTFSASGRVPAFLTELVERGEAEIDREIFNA